MQDSSQLPFGLLTDWDNVLMENQEEEGQVSIAFRLADGLGPKSLSDKEYLAMKLVSIAFRLADGLGPSRTGWEWETRRKVSIAFRLADGVGQQSKKVNTFENTVSIAFRLADGLGQVEMAGQADVCSVSQSPFGLLTDWDDGDASSAASVLWVSIAFRLADGLGRGCATAKKATEAPAGLNRLSAC